MKKLFSIFVTVLVLAVGGCAPQLDPEAEREAIHKFHDECIKALLSGNVDCFAEEAQFLPPNAPPIKGKKAIGELVTQMIEDPNFSGSHDIVTVEVSRSGDLATIHYTYELVTSAPDGKPVAEHGKAIYILKKQPQAGWKIWIDIWNVDTPEVSAGPVDLELSAEELEGIQDLDRRFVDAYNRLDIDDLMDCLWNSPNLVVLLYDGTVYVGWDTVREITEATFAGLESANVKIDEITYLRSGDAIMAVGTASYELQPKDGPLKKFTGRWTDFRRIENGKWVYVSDHAQALAPQTP